MRSASASGSSTRSIRAQRDVAMVFQNYALYPHMSVFDNLAFPLRAHGLPKAQVRVRVERTASCSVSTASSGASPGRCPAGSASGLRWGGRSSASRKCF